MTYAENTTVAVEKSHAEIDKEPGKPCRECSRDRVRRHEQRRRDAGLVGPANATKTHCKNDHLLDEENTYKAPNGSRQCKTCRRETLRALRQRRAVSSTL